MHDGKVAGKDAHFDTLCLHAGYGPDATTSRAVPIYRTSPFVFKSTEHAAKLFALAELGNIYTRLQNPTNDILEKRVAMLEGAHPLGALGVASGTTAVFYSMIDNGYLVPGGQVLGQRSGPRAPDNGQRTKSRTKSAEQKRDNQVL